MNIVKLTDTVAVAGQVSPEDVEEIAASGYRVLVNNRPDGEAPDQPAGEAIAAAAQAAGMSYFHLPVTAADFPGPDIQLMASLLDNADEPVLAFCRTGTRCTTLWVTTRPEAEKGEAQARAKSLGFDLAMSDRC